MTREELKENYSMLSIVNRYGFQPNRSGYINCPFHIGDRDASMKIYHDSYHCFGCGANGDIFSFVQRMDNVSFKEAFLSLGGIYEKPTFHSNMAIYHAKKAREMREKERVKMLQHKKLNNKLIDIYRYYVNKSEPFSEVWCDCLTKLQYQLYIHDELGKRW